MKSLDSLPRLRSLTLSVLPPLTVWLICFALWFSNSACRTNSAPSNTASRNLLALREPDLQPLEATVRQQLEKQLAAFKALQQKPQLSDAELAEGYGELGRVYHAYRLAEAAEVCYRNAQTLAPKDYRWPHYLGHVYNVLNDTEKAAANFQQALSLKPDNHSAMVGLAENYLQQNRLDEAEPLLQKATNDEMTRATATADLGKVALARRNYSAAVAQFEAALREMPEANELYYPLAQSYRGLGNEAKAAASLAQRGTGKVRFGDALMAELSELIEGSHSLVARGSRLLSQRKYQEAHEAFKQAVAADAANITARLNYGASFAYLGQYEPAKEQFQIVLRDAPRTPLAHIYLGRVLAWEKRDAEAIKAFRAGVTYDPNHADGYLFLADALMRTGQYSPALAAYQQSISLNPGRLHAQARLVPALIKLNRYREAREHIEALATKHPSNREFVQVLVRLLAAAPDNAVRDGKLALALAQRHFAQGNDPVALQTMAMAWAETGDFAQAAQRQRTAIEALRVPLATEDATPDQRETTIANEADLLTMLRADLQLYEKKQPCRRPWLANARIFFPPRPR